MTVIPYAAEHYPMVNGWWRAHHGALSDLPEVMLPPLGAMVLRDGVPVFVMWCAEPAGCCWALLEYPVAAPGQSLPEAREAFQECLRALTALAGKTWEPPGHYSIFRANPSISLFRAMRDEGFVEEYPNVEHTPVIYIAGD